LEIYPGRITTITVIVQADQDASRLVAQRQKTNFENFLISPEYIDMCSFGYGV